MAFNKEKVEEYIKAKEEEKKAEWSDLLGSVAELVWVENETKDELNLFKWLKNDENLLQYAELATKAENLTFGESIRFKLLELKLSVTCSYFSDFKIFLKELKAWTNTSWNDESIESYIDGEWNWKREFCWIPVTQIQSLPYQRSSTTWVTWCAKTARENWERFWLNLPHWNAYDAGTKPWADCLATIPGGRKNEKPQNKRSWITLETFKSECKWNYADIYTNSTSNYGHRAAAFKDSSWQRYVLDPYTRVNWRLDNTPKKLDDYLQSRKIVKAHFYESTWYKS